MNVVRYKITLYNEYNVINNITLFEKQIAHLFGFDL